jgi:recombination protein RecT
MGTAVANRDKLADVVQTIDRPEFQKQLQEALPENLTVERFTRTTKIAIQMNPGIVNVDRHSLFRAMVRCAQDGLLPDGREAALVEVKVKGDPHAAYWPMIGGFRKKAAEHGFGIEAHAVYENDRFEYELGFDPHVKHQPPRLSEPRGELIGAYAVGTGPDGRKFLEVMGRSEIEAVRQVSRAKDSEYGPWTKWPAEMYRKTVARRLFKQLPLASEPAVARMLRADDATSLVDDRALEESTALVPELAGLPVDVDDEPVTGEVVE